MKKLVDSAEQSDTRRDESSRPSSDTLDSLVRRCGSCRYDPQIYGICKRCIDYDQWTPPNESNERQL